jgi:hypothetical protein
MDSSGGAQMMLSVVVDIVIDASRSCAPALRRQAALGCVVTFTCARRRAAPDDDETWHRNVAVTAQLGSRSI